MHVFIFKIEHFAICRVFADPVTYSLSYGDSIIKFTISAVIKVIITMGPDLNDSAGGIRCSLHHFVCGDGDMQMSLQKA